MKTSRALARLLATALIVATPAALPSAAQADPDADPDPRPGSEQSLPVRGVDAAAAAQAPTAPRARAMGSSAGRSSTVALTPQQDTDPFRLVGVTWSGQRSDVAVWARTRTDDGWSGWTELPVSDEHAPDPGAGEAAAQRGGTDPMIVEESDAVQVRIDDLPGGTSGEPQDAEVELVDPGVVSADSSSTAQDASPTDVAAAGSRSSALRAEPEVLSRASWGADESIRRGSPSYGDIKGGFVHHTVNSNSYSAAEVPAMIRSIYRYHVQGRGWNDIGYNFIVDRFGRVWEGRAGGVDRPVVGAHTAGYNSNSFAMSALGDHTSTAVPSAVRSAYARLYAWKLGRHHADPRRYAWIPSGSSTLVTPTISGHRDAGQTACPGQRLYDRLPSIRQATGDAQGAMFYNPKVAETSWRYGTAGSNTGLTARVQGRVEYRLEIRNSCEGLVRYRRGFASASSPIDTGWSGRLADGSWAPPGYYYYTLTAIDRDGRAEPVPTWTSGRIWIRSTTSSPPSFCQQARS